MKAGTMRIRSKGHHPAGGIQIKNEKNRPSLKTVKNDNKSENSKYKPLWGKVFYLDLPSVVISERLEKDLKELGGRVEEFLSKDISYLISNKKEAKYAQTLGCISPVPSPESTCTGGNTSPHPSCDGSSFKTPDPVCMSRGKLLVEKAIKEHEFIPSNSILSNALSWGVKILHIDDIKYYIEQKKKELYLIKKSSTSLREGKRLGIQKTKTGRLKKPFVKVEDSSHHYRPFYLQLSNIPLINYSIPKPCSPFDLDKTSSLQKQTQAKQRNRMGCEADEGRCPPARPRLRENKKKGYCECCSQRYEALQTHLLSEQHRNFAQSTQYQVVDDIISKLVYDFVEYKSNISRRVKCSIGSFAPIIGNTFKRNEPEKQLELHHVSPNDSWGHTTKQVIKQDFQYQECRDPSQKVAFSSEPIDSFASCSPCPYNSASKLGEHLECRKSYLINPAKKDSELDLERLPLNKDTQGCAPEVCDRKGTINEQDLEELKTEFCPYVLETFMHVSDFDQTDKNVSQLKRKSDGVIFPDTRQKKKGTVSPHSNGSSLTVISHSPEQPAGQAETISHSPPDEELREAAVESTDSLPSGKLHRKVKIVLGRNKKRSQQKNVQLPLKNKAELPATKEENSICSSPVQPLVELFQTSEDSSEFLGFTGYSENHSSRDVLEVWEEESGNSLLSMFLSSPSSTSTFTGF
ncbi:protein DBF4 homolog A isoform X1 [Trichosurus vulpecula]|uniref:protein DBF4 homolog A isoform X1 n=1 Tax=Trichosurus vulpecula TaxID=9337 RepID=UPI00186AE191|nr:protein DBF4 homolog A isoform X1 [Trichosurus vulpecula]